MDNSGRDVRARSERPTAGTQEASRRLPVDPGLPIQESMKSYAGPLSCAQRKPLDADSKDDEMSDSACQSCRSRRSICDRRGATYPQTGQIVVMCRVGYLAMLNVMQLYGSLDNYILSLRTQCGLSQKDLAFLLGERRELIVRCEQQSQLPPLRSGISLGLIFDEPIESVFAGVSEKMRAQVAARARVLLRDMPDKTPDENAVKLTTLARLAHLDEEDVTPCSAA